ncbi:MAG: hypothetical protein L3J03_12085, partial [Desulfobacterales bacterium]|nr:hypothetical protein [Desulfobacterales bacterium]
MAETLFFGFFLLVTPEKKEAGPSRPASFGVTTNENGWLFLPLSAPHAGQADQARAEKKNGGRNGNLGGLVFNNKIGNP